MTDQHLNVNIQVPIDLLRKQKIFLATPMYGGQCAGMYTKSVADLAALCTHYGITVQLYFLFNESLITRARNYVCDEFMRSDCTHLMFIDSDIGFDPHDVIALLALTVSPEAATKYDIIGGPYPKKCISWEKIKMAVEQGKADESAQELEKYVGDYVFNPIGTKDGTIHLGSPCEVLEIGTGFMMIPRDTMVKFAAAYPQYMYKPDHVRTAAFDGTREIMMFFQAEIDPKSKRYLSEDYWFTQKAQKIGLKTWLCPWMKLSHMGSYVFGGSLADLASIGASATADISQLKNRK
jgi:hypothetical protein